MDAGLRIINDSGVVQIDSTYSNYYLHSKQVVTLAAVPGFPRVSQVTVAPPYPSQCLIALGGAAPVTIKGQTSNQVWIESSNDFIGSAVTVYYFVPANLSPLVGTGEGGLRVYGPTGALVFDNSAKMVKILGYVPDANGSSGLDTGISGQYAAVVLNDAYYISYNRVSGGQANNNAEWTQTVSRAYVRPTQTGLTFYGTTEVRGPFTASDNPPPNPVYIGPMSVLLVDVTNY
ncbi:p24 [Xanthomonas phage Xop411]|uniref:p24 n=1 Tax=Xanthomonas phage Xop411 TaxID=2913975 RepID=A5H1M7_9CAUD|nr:p24 [Xanthomonas phage Xop411]ABK00171.1 p24 [Xanthomonas phage Xop411]